MATDRTDVPRVRVVFDTNTVMALWHFNDPALARLRGDIDSGRIAPVIRDDCLEELRRVAAYEQFGMSEEEQQVLLAAYISACENTGAIIIPDGLPRCSDPDDQKFIELAVQAHAAVLISRDKALLRMGKHRLLRDRLIIVTPERYALP